MNKLLVASTLALLIMISSKNAMACDDKACEKAYLSSTTQYIANHGRQTVTRTEREAQHAKNRERRDYAVQDHIHQN